MADLTASRSLPWREPPEGFQVESLPMAGYTNFGGGTTAFTIYKHSIVFCDQSDTDGYFRDVDGAVAATTSDIFGGISVEKQAVTSSDLADGSVNISVRTNGIVGLPKGSIAQTDIGAIAYATDDTVITTDANDTLAIGLIKEVDSTYVWVAIENYAGMVSSTTT